MSVTDADWARALTALDKPTRPERIAAVVAWVARERQTVASRFLGLAEAWEHVAEVNASAAPGSHDDGLRKGLAHAAEAVRRAAEVDL